MIVILDKKLLENENVKYPWNNCFLCVILKDILLIIYTIKHARASLLIYFPCKYAFNLMSSKNIIIVSDKNNRSVCKFSLCFVRRNCGIRNTHAAI